MPAGDAASVQGRFLDLQGQREFKASGQGQMRWTFFHQPMRATPIEGSYQPSDALVCTTVARCKFPVLYQEPPILSVSVWLCDTMEWTTDDPQPEITACVVNWWRPKDNWQYAAADVSVTIREIPEDVEVVGTMAFYGPALAVPVTKLEDWEATNPSYDGTLKDPAYDQDYKT